MAPIFSIKPAKVARMSEAALKVWIETVVTRMGIPIVSSDESSDLFDAEVVLGGEYEHCRVTYARGSYAVWGYNPFHDYDQILDGEGDLHDELVHARKLTLDINAAQGYIEDEQISPEE